MKTSTRITLNRKTTFTPDRKPEDGGTALLLEALEMIREEGQVGSLTAQIGPGGTIANLSFVKEDRIPANSDGIVFSEQENGRKSVTVEMDETDHLMSSPPNAKRLLDAVGESKAKDRV